MKRHFILFYNVFPESGGTGVGNFTHSTDGSFPSYSEIIQILRTGLPKLNPILTNIIELSEEDYNDWIK